jgi:hypothetical protein
MAYGTINADVIGTSVAGSNLGAGNASIMKNRIINGAMVIDQRNAGTAVTVSTTGVFVVDRFRSGSNGTWGSGVFSAQQNKGSVTPPAGFTNYVGMATTTAVASIPATNSYDFVQPIEGYNTADLGWGTANAKTVTLSFWVYSNLTGTFAGNLQNTAADRFYVFSYSISVANTWTQISVTIAGDTSGTWNKTNDLGINARFSLGTGSTYLGTAGSWGATAYSGVTGQQQVISSTSNYWYMTGLQLEVGSSATGFEYRQYGQELALCQRYYYALSYGYATPINGGIGNVTIYSAGTAAGSIYSVIQFPNNMRTAPTLNATSGTAYYKLNTNGSALTFDTLTLNDYTNTSATIYNGSVISSSVTAGYSGWLRFNSNSAYIAFTAEL